VRKLRQKIEADPNQPRLVVNVSGVGYRLENRMETSVAD
jgi:two-component system KDP operon response regulator KdpE